MTIRDYSSYEQRDPTQKLLWKPLCRSNVLLVGHKLSIAKVVSSSLETRVAKRGRVTLSPSGLGLRSDYAKGPCSEIILYSIYLGPKEFPYNYDLGLSIFYRATWTRGIMAAVVSSQFEMTKNLARVRPVWLMLFRVSQTVHS